MVHNMGMLLVKTWGCCGAKHGDVVTARKRVSASSKASCRLLESYFSPQG